MCRSGQFSASAEGLPSYWEDTPREKPKSSSLPFAASTTPSERNVSCPIRGSSKQSNPDKIRIQPQPQSGLDFRLYAIEVRGRMSRIRNRDFATRAEVHTATSDEPAFHLAGHRQVQLRQYGCWITVGHAAQNADSSETSMAVFNPLPETPPMTSNSPSST